jgi:probable rRNA maturation factor
LARVRRELGFDEADLTVCFVSDAEIARMNQAFRKKKGPTDVLSFPAIERRRPAIVRAQNPGRLRGKRIPEFLGDIAIAPSVARRNARKFGRTVLNELRILILHGLLHLLGYDHETDRGQMSRLEGRLRRKLGLT